MQSYIFLQLTYNYGTQNNYGITLEDLYMSLSVSVLNLMINFWEFNREAKLHGMMFSEYALTVLQLAEVPITKFVPRLPGKYIDLFYGNISFCG